MCQALCCCFFFFCGSSVGCVWISRLSPYNATPQPKNSCRSRGPEEQVHNPEESPHFKCWNPKIFCDNPADKRKTRSAEHSLNGALWIWISLPFLVLEHKRWVLQSGRTEGRPAGADCLYPQSTAVFNSRYKGPCGAWGLWGQVPLEGFVWGSHGPWDGQGAETFVVTWIIWALPAVRPRVQWLPLGLSTPFLPLLSSLCEVPSGRSTMWWCSILQGGWNVPCPLPPNPPPHPLPPHPLPLDPPALGPHPCRKQGGQGRIDDITGKGLRTAVALSTASCLFSISQGALYLISWIRLDRHRQRRQMKKEDEFIDNKAGSIVRQTPPPIVQHRTRSCITYQTEKNQGLEAKHTSASGVDPVVPGGPRSPDSPDKKKLSLIWAKGAKVLSIFRPLFRLDGRDKIHTSASNVVPVVPGSPRSPDSPDKTLVFHFASFVPEKDKRFLEGGFRGGELLKSPTPTEKGRFQPHLPLPQNCLPTRQEKYWSRKWEVDLPPRAPSTVGLMTWSWYLHSGMNHLPIVSIHGRRRRVGVRTPQRGQDPESPLRFSIPRPWRGSWTQVPKRVQGFKPQKWLWGWSQLRGVDPSPWRGFGSQVLQNLSSHRDLKSWQTLGVDLRSATVQGVWGKYGHGDMHQWPERPAGLWAWTPSGIFVSGWVEQYTDLHAKIVQHAKKKEWKSWHKKRVEPINQVCGNPWIR